MAVPAKAEGIAPRRRQPTIHFLGPYRSQRGPIIRRTIRVAVRATTLPFAMSSLVRLRSVRSVKGVSGGKAYQERKATMKPSQDRKKTRPCMQIGFLRVRTRISGTYENWNPFCFVVDGIDVGCRPKLTDLQHIEMITWRN